MKFGSFYGITVFNMLVFDIQPKFVKESLDNVSYQKRLEIESDLTQEAYNLLNIDSFFTYSCDYESARDTRVISTLDYDSMKKVLASILCKGMARDFNYFHYFGDSDLLVKYMMKEFKDSETPVNKCVKDIKEIVKSRFSPVACDCAEVCKDYGITRTLNTEYYYQNNLRTIDDNLRTILEFLDSKKSVLIELITDLTSTGIQSNRTFFSENAIRNAVIEELSLVYKDSNKYNFQTTLDRVRALVYSTSESSIDHSDEIKEFCEGMDVSDIEKRLQISNVDACIDSLFEMGLYGLNVHTRELYEENKNFIPSAEGKRLDISETLKAFVDSLIPIGGDI